MTNVIECAPEPLYIDTVYSSTQGAKEPWVLFALQACRRFFLLAGGRFILRTAEAGADEPLNRAPEVELFYTSWTWRKCRKAFAESKGNLCERCMKRGIIEAGSKDRPLEVHHKIPLTAENITDPNVALAWSNLELLCKSCHDEERERRAKRWRIGKDGRVIL